jgi:hypothetical protein
VKKISQCDVLLIYVPLMLVILMSIDTQLAFALGSWTRRLNYYATHKITDCRPRDSTNSSWYYALEIINQAITFDGEQHASPDGLNELFMYQLPHALYAIVDFSRMTCSPCKDSLEPTLLD